MAEDLASAHAASRIARAAVPAPPSTSHRTAMLSKWQHNLLVGLGALAVLLVVANGVLFTQNRAAQAALNRRQAFVQQTVPLEGLYNEIVKTLAQMGVKGNDRQMLNM